MDYYNSCYHEDPSTQVPYRLEKLEETITDLKAEIKELVANRDQMEKEIADNRNLLLSLIECLNTKNKIEE